MKDSDCTGARSHVTVSANVKVCFLFVQMRLRLELLQVDEQSADVAHSFHLGESR